jgi:hypothetical protein
MFAAFKKCSRQTFALDEKCLRPLKNVRAQPSRLMKNVCGLSKMFRPTFAPDEKCLRLFEKWS